MSREQEAILRKVLAELAALPIQQRLNILRAATLLLMQRQMDNEMGQVRRAPSANSLAA